MKVLLKLLWCGFVFALEFPQQPLMVESPANSGIGISFTASHATISVRYSDGSFKDLGRVDGNPDYFHMMERLSSKRSIHSCPPYKTMEDLLSDWPRHTLRSLRKRMGLPASSDVAVLIKMIKELGNVATDPDLMPRPVVLSYPALVGLCEEDILDAAEYHHITLEKWQSSHQPREIYAAYAGHGMGLCESYMGKEKCRSEELAMPVHEVLLVEYTQYALLLHASVMREARDVLLSYGGVAASFKLGSINAGVEGHTEHVTAFVLEYLHTKYPVLGTPDNPIMGLPKEIMVIMTGNPEAVGDSAVQKAIEDAVKALGSTATMITDMPEYAASRGAAELARRAWFLSESDTKADL